MHFAVYGAICLAGLVIGWVAWGAASSARRRASRLDVFLAAVMLLAVVGGAIYLEPLHWSPWAALLGLLLPGYLAYRTGWRLTFALAAPVEAIGFALSGAVILCSILVRLWKPTEADREAIALACFVAPAASAYLFALLDPFWIFGTRGWCDANAEPTAVRSASHASRPPDYRSL